MNERIRELAEQALCIKGGEFAFNGGEVELVDLKKFAELIVRECGRVAWHHCPENEELEFGHLIKDKILEHFGVEE